MLKRLRERAGSESGFTLIELLVVMLILGILAAIAIPAFLNQRSKANDAQSKTVARTLQTAMETCGTDNGGSYTAPRACNLAALEQIEATLPPAPAAVALPNNPAGGYTVRGVNAASGNTFSIVRAANGDVTRPCTVNDTDRGGCPGNGVAAGTW
jgi:type IV pilus assembly protein PilA